MGVCSFFVFQKYTVGVGNVVYAKFGVGYTFRAARALCGIFAAAAFFRNAYASQADKLRVVFININKLFLAHVARYNRQAAARHDRTVSQNRQQPVTRGTAVDILLPARNELQGARAGNHALRVESGGTSAELYKFIGRQGKVRNVLCPGNNYTVVPELIHPDIAAKSRKTRQLAEVFALCGKGYRRKYTCTAQGANSADRPAEAAFSANAVVHLFGAVKTHLYKINAAGFQQPCLSPADQCTVSQDCGFDISPRRFLEKAEKRGVCQRLAARNIKIALETVLFQQLIILVKDIPERVRRLKGSVIVLVAVRAAQVAAVCDVPLKGKISVVADGFDAVHFLHPFLIILYNPQGVFAIPA